jgi:hypothetical protein
MYENKLKKIEQQIRERRQKAKEARQKAKGFLTKWQIRLGVLFATSLVLFPPYFIAEGLVPPSAISMWGRRFFLEFMYDRSRYDYHVDWGYIVYELVLYALVSTILIWIAARIYGWSELDDEIAQGNTR